MTDTTTAASEPSQAVGAPVEQPVRPPMRALRLTLKLEADNRPELAWAMRNMADQIEREELTVGVSGGPYSGAIYELLHDPAQTHEQYFRDVQAYLAEQQSSGMQTAEEMAADRYRVKRTGLGWWRVSVGDGQQTVGRCFTRAEAEKIASGLRTAFLDGAHVVVELNEYRRAMRELGQLVREQSRSRITPAPHA